MSEKKRRQRKKEEHPEERKGRRAEERFDEACQKIAERPSWLIAVRWSDVDEDRFLGVDFWAETVDAGHIPIQVKTSLGGVKHFVPAHPELSRECLFLIIREADTLLHIQEMLIVGLEYHRSRRLHGHAALPALGVYVGNIEIIRR